MRLRQPILRRPAALDGVPPALARLVLGWMFVSAGATALAHRAAVRAYFTRLGIPWPAVVGPFVGGVELAGGTMLLLGLGVRLASLPLFAIMLVAIAIARRNPLPVQPLRPPGVPLRRPVSLAGGRRGPTALPGRFVDGLVKGAAARRRPHGALYGAESISAEALDS